MANQIILSLLVFILHFSRAEIIDCGKSAECNCSSTATPGETCTLNCHSADICKGKTLNCRSGDPCFINCESSASCSDNTIINAQTSTDVTIQCEGTDACKTGIDIKCGTGKCKLQCDTVSSCDNWGKINVTNSLGFECIGIGCPTSLIPLFFSALPTYTPTTSPTNIPTISPTYNTLNATNNSSNNPIIITMLPTNNPHINTNSPPVSTTSEIISKNNIYNRPTKRGIKFHDHEHYMTDPLFYMITSLLILILCAFCLLCVWIWSKEQQQKRSQLQHKLKAKPSISNSNSYSKTESNSISSNITNKLNKQSNTKPSMDNSSELYAKNEGPLPTYLKINTTDLNTHSSLIMNNTFIAKSYPIRPRSILLPSHANSDGSNTKSLPKPPPRRSLPLNKSANKSINSPLSPYGVSNYSSPANTPIPKTPINMNNIINNNILVYENEHEIYEDIKIENNENDVHFDFKQLQPNNYNNMISFKKHCHYASLPTIPSLPAITPEHSISYTEMNLSTNHNNNYNIIPSNNPQLNNNTNSSLHSIKISMISCMTSMDSMDDNINKERDIENTETRYENSEMSETEYESHRKQTWETYDMGTSFSASFNIQNKSLKAIQSKSDFDISVIGKASTIKLDDIREESKKSIVSSLNSETSVANDDTNDSNSNDDILNLNDEESSVEKNLVEKSIELRNRRLLSVEKSVENNI